MERCDVIILLKKLVVTFGNPVIAIKNLAGV
jgi:hypothetical protein